MICLHHAYSVCSRMLCIHCPLGSFATVSCEHVRHLLRTRGTDKNEPQTCMGAFSEDVWFFAFLNSLFPISMVFPCFPIQASPQFLASNTNSLPLQHQPRKFQGSETCNMGLHLEDHPGPPTTQIRVYLAKSSKSLGQ